MNNNGEGLNTSTIVVPPVLARDIKGSQKQMSEGNPTDRRLLDLSLNPKPMGETKEEQLNYNIPVIDETLRNEFINYYGKGSYTSLCRKIDEISELAHSVSTLANIINQTKASLKLIELVTNRTPPLSYEEIDEELRRLEQPKQFTGKTHGELKKIVQAIRTEAKSPLAEIIRKNNVSIRLISLATQEPNLNIQQIDQAIHTLSAVTEEQKLEAKLDPTILMEKVKAIKAAAKLKSLSEVQRETKASLTLIELALKNETITSDEELKQALKKDIPLFDPSTLNIEMIKGIRRLETRNTSFPQIVRRYNVPLRLVAIVTAKKLLEVKQIQQEMNTESGVDPDSTLGHAELAEKIRKIKLQALTEKKPLAEIQRATKASIRLIELACRSDSSKTVDMKEIQRELTSPSISSSADLKTVSLIRKSVKQKIHFTEIIRTLGISLKLFELATAEVYSYSKPEIEHAMQQPQLNSVNELKLSPIEFSKKIKQVRGLLLEGWHPFAIQEQLKVSFQLIELVGREQFALDEMQAKLWDQRSKKDPDFTGESFSELERLVGAIRKGFAANKSIGQIMETKSTIRLIELALHQQQLELSDIEREIRLPASDPDFNGMSYKTIRDLVRSIRETHYKQPIPSIPPVVTSPSSRRLSLAMPERKTVALKVIPAPTLRHWEYSSTVRLEHSFERARELAASLTSSRYYEAVELEAHFKQLIKNNREPETLEIYLFFRPLFDSDKIDGQCKALQLLHSKQDKRIRQLIIRVLQGVLKPNRERAIQRLFDNNPLSFIENLEDQLNRKEKNNKKIRDFILAHYTIFEKLHGKLSLTQYGFKKLIVIFQLFQTKLDELDPTSSALNPGPKVISLRQLCKMPAKQAKILLDIFKNSRKGHISGEITRSEEIKIIYWLLKEGYGLSFIERYCLETKNEALVHELFFTLLHDDQRIFERRLNHPSIKTMGLIFAAKHFARQKNENILFDDTLQRQALHLGNVIHMVFGNDDLPLPPMTPQSSNQSSRGSIDSGAGSFDLSKRAGSLSPFSFDEKKGDAKSTRFLAHPVQRTEEQISNLSISSRPPVTLIVLALYFLNLKNEFFISEKIRDNLTWMLNQNPHKFWQFVNSLLEVPIFDPRYMDKREKLLAEIAKVLALVQNKLLPDFLAEGFAKNLSSEEDKGQFIANFLQAADSVFTVDLLSGVFAYDQVKRDAKLKICRLLTELISADATLSANNLEEIDFLNTFINITICELSALCESHQMYHLLPLRFNSELSQITLLKCVFAFPFHLITLKDNDYFSRLRAPNVPCTDENPSERLNHWKSHRLNIFMTIFDDAFTYTLITEKRNFYKFVYYFCKRNFPDLLEEISQWCQHKAEQEDFTEPSEFLQLIEELGQLNLDNEEEKEIPPTSLLPLFPTAFNENDEGESLSLRSRSHRLPEKVRTVKFVPLMGTVMQGLVNLINALKEENHQKSSKTGFELTFKQELCKVLNRLLSNQTSCWYFLEIMNSADLMEEFASLIKTESKPELDEKGQDEEAVIAADPSSLKSVFLRTYQAFDSLRLHYHYSPHFARQVALFNFGLHYLGTGNLSPFEQDAVATWLERSWENRDDSRQKNISGYLPEFIQLLVEWWPYQSPDIEYFEYLEKFTKSADSISSFRKLIGTIGVYLLTKTEDLEFDFILLTPTIELFQKAYIRLSQDLKPDAIINFLEVLLAHFDRIDNFLQEIYLNEYNQHCPQFTDRLVALRSSIITIFIEINKAIKFNQHKNLKIELEKETEDLPPIIKKTRKLLTAAESPSLLQNKILSLTTEALQTNRFATQFITVLTEQDQDDRQSSPVDFSKTQKLASDGEMEDKELDNSQGSFVSIKEDETKAFKTEIHSLKEVHPKVLTASLRALIRQCRSTPHNLLPINYLDKIKYFVSSYLKIILFYGEINTEEAIKILQFKVWPSYLNELGTQKKANNWREMTSLNWFPQLDLYQYVCNLLGMPIHEDECQIAYTIETMSHRRLREEIIFQYIQEGIKLAFISLAFPPSETMAPSIKEEINGQDKKDSKTIEIELEPFLKLDEIHHKLENRLKSSQPQFREDDRGQEDPPYDGIPNLPTISRTSVQTLADRKGTAEPVGQEAQYNIYLRQLMIGFLQKIEDQVLKFIAIKGNGFTALLETEYTAFLRSAVRIYAPTNKFNYFCDEKPESFLFLQILDILKDALVSKLDERVLTQLKKILCSEAHSSLFKNHPHFVNKCLEFLDRYFFSDAKQEHKGHVNFIILNPDSSAAETIGQSSRLSALAAIGSIGCPISFDHYQNIPLQLLYLNVELEERQKVLQVAQNRTEWSAEIEAVLGQPPESIEYISQVIIRIFSALGESYPPFLSSAHKLILSKEITRLFARAKLALIAKLDQLGKKIEIKEKLDSLLKFVNVDLEKQDSLLEFVNVDLEKVYWLGPAKLITIHLMQAAVLMKVAQAFNNYKIHASVAKAAVIGLKPFVEKLLSISPLEPGLSGEESSARYRRWHTCYQTMLHLAKIIFIGDIKRLKLYDPTQSKVRQRLNLHKQYQQMLEASFGYEDSDNSQLKIVVMLLSNVSLTFEREGAKAPEWLDKFLEQCNLLLFPIIYIPTESKDLELIADLGSKFEDNLTAEIKELPRLLMPLSYIDKEKKYESERKISVTDLDEQDDEKEFQRKGSHDPFAFSDDSKKEVLASLPKKLIPSLPDPSLYSLWIKIISSHPQLKNSGLLERIESHRSVMDGPYQAYFAGETLRILFAIIRNQPNKFRGYCLVEGLQQVFDQFKVDETKPFANLFAKMKYKLSAFRAQYSFNIEEIAFAGICADFSFDIEKNQADERILTNVDQVRVALLIRTSLNSNLFEGEKGKNTRRIMKDFTNLQNLPRDMIKLLIFKMVLELLFPKMKNQISTFIKFLENSPSSVYRTEKLKEALFTLLAQISQLHDSENPQLISSFIDYIESQLIIAFLDPAEDDGQPKLIQRELEIFCHARDTHEKLKSSTDWNQLDEKSIQRRINDFWRDPSHLMVARILHILGIKVLSNSQCRFLFKTNSNPEILESIISSFETILMSNAWIEARNPALVDVFNSLLSKLLGQKIGIELTDYVRGISENISKESIDVRALFEFMLCACMLRTPSILLTYKREKATSSLLLLAGYLVLTKTTAEQSAVFRMTLDLLSIMKQVGLLGIEDVGLTASYIATNEYDLLRAYIEYRQQKALTTSSSHPEDADRYQVLYLYSFIAEKIANYTYQSKKPLANIPVLTASVKEWHKKIKTKITEEVPEEGKAKQSRNLLLNDLLREAGKMLQLAQQYPTVVNDTLGTKSQFVSGLLQTINRRIGHETGALKEDYQFSNILESKTVKKYFTDLHRIQKILFEENPSFPESVSPEIFKNFKASISGMQPMEIWTQTCWFFFYSQSIEKNAEFEQSALAWLSSSAPEELVRNDYLKLNCVLNYIEACAEKDFEGRQISNLDLLNKLSEARKLVDQTAPKGSLINQLYVARLSIEFVKNGHPKVLDELSSCMFPLVVEDKIHVSTPPVRSVDFDDLNDSKETKRANVLELDDDSFLLFPIEDEKGHHDAEQEKILQATKLLFNYYRTGFALEMRGELLSFSNSIATFSDSSKKYLFNLVKLVFSQLGALEQSSVRWGQWKKLLLEMFEDVRPLMPSFTLYLTAEQQDIGSLLFSLNQYFNFNFENDRSFCQQILVEMLLALQKHRLNPRRKSIQKIRDQDLEQIKFVLEIAQIPDERLTDAATWFAKLGLGAPEELEPLMLSFLSAEHLFKALGVSYSVVFNKFTEDEKQSALPAKFHALVKEKFVEAFGNQPFDEVVKFSQWAGKTDGLEILLVELLSLFLDEDEKNEKPLIELLVKSSNVSEGIYSRIITLLFTVFKDQSDYQQKMMGYLSLDAAIKLQHQLRFEDGSNFKIFGRAIQRRTLEAYYLYTGASSTQVPNSVDPAYFPPLSILEYIKSLRTNLNSAFYGFYELFRMPYYKETETLAIEQVDNLIKLVDSAAGLLLGEDHSLSLREPFQELYRVDNPEMVPRHIIDLNDQLNKLQGDDAVLSFEELIKMVLSVAKLDSYMQNLLQQLFLHTADYVQQRFLQKCMEALEIIDSDVRENIIFALLYAQRIEFQKQFDFNDRDIYIFNERPLNLNSFKNCFVLIKSIRQLFLINRNGDAENLFLPPLDFGSVENSLPSKVATAEGLLVRGTDSDKAAFQMISNYNRLKFRSEILTMFKADVKTLTNEQNAFLTRFADLFDNILLTLHLLPNCPAWLNDLDWLTIIDQRRTSFQLTDSINFIDFIKRIDEISKKFAPMRAPKFNRAIKFGSGPSSILQLDLWSCLLSYLNSQEVFVIKLNPEDDKLHLITNPFKYRTVIRTLNEGIAVSHYSIFTGNERGLLPARQEIRDYRKNRPGQEIKEFKGNGDSDNRYFNDIEGFLSSTEAEIGLLKSLIEVINRQKLESLEAEIKEAKNHRGNPVDPITLFKLLFNSILDLISEKDKIIKPLLEGIIKDVTELGRYTPPKEVAWYWSEYVFKPFFDQKQFCQVIFQKLLSWMLFNLQRLDDQYIRVILEFGVAAGVEPLNLLQIFASYEELRQKFPRLEFEIAIEVYTSKMRLDQSIDLASFIRYKLESDKLSALEFFTEVYKVSHNARSVIACILTKLGFNTSERYISVENVKNISQNLIQYLESKIIPLDLALALIALLKRLPPRNADHEDDDLLAISCEDELVPDKDCIATALCHIYPSFLVKDTKDVDDEVNHLDRDRIKRYAKELPTTMARCLENYLYDQFKPNIEERCLEQVNPAWKFALNKYCLLLQLVEFFNKEIVYGASLIGDLELMFSKLKNIFGISVFDHPNLISKLADKDQNEQENIKIQYLTNLKELKSIGMASSTPYQHMCEDFIHKAFLYLNSELRRLFEVDGVIHQLLFSSLPLQMLERGRIKQAYAKHDTSIFGIIDLPKNEAIQMLLRLCQQQMERLGDVIDKFKYYLLHMGIRHDLVSKDLQITYKKAPRQFLQRIRGQEEVEILPREAIIPEDRALRIRYENFAKKYPDDAKKIFGINTYRQLLNPESDDLITRDEKSFPQSRRESFSLRFLSGHRRKENGINDNDEKSQPLLTRETPFLTQIDGESFDSHVNEEGETDAILDNIDQTLLKALEARREVKEIIEGGGIPKVSSFRSKPNLATSSFRITTTLSRPPSPADSVGSGQGEDEDLNNAMSLKPDLEKEIFGY